MNYKKGMGNVNMKRFVSNDSEKGYSSNKKKKRTHKKTVSDKETNKESESCLKRTHYLSVLPQVLSVDTRTVKVLSDHQRCHKLVTFPNSSKR